MFILSTFSEAQDSIDSRASNYPVPDLKSEIFDPEAISKEVSAEVADLLVEAASARSNKDPVLKAKCLAIALRLNSVHKGAFITHLKLKKGELPEPTGGDALKDIGDRLMEISESVETIPRSGDKLASYLVSIGTDLGAQDGSGDASQGSIKTPRSSEVSWAAILPEVKGVTVTSEGSEDTPRRKQSSIKGLLVRDLGFSKYAGKASLMNATVIDRRGTSEMRAIFNQPVGDSMESALREVMKFMSLRHSELPVGQDIEISFEEQYIPKDGPSAAVSCALLLEGLISNQEWEESFAVTGDLNADGSVQPVGGIDGKIRGATSRDCAIVAVPHQSAAVIGDIQLVDGSEMLRDIQIFSIETFDDALALATVHDRKEAELKQAIEIFSEVQEVLQKPSGLRYLMHNQVITRLRQVLELAPNHLSARYLLLKAQKRDPQILTLRGSLNALDRAAAPMIIALRAGEFTPSASSLDSDDYGDAVSQLSRLRRNLDPKVQPSADALLNFAKLMREFVNSPPSTEKNWRALVDEIKDAAKKVNSSYDSLRNSVEFQEGLNR